ncbi:MAG: efflux RND transporter permease subunit [Candidatus Omnitrophica bacterium]|nr:efflux RND transporter permease subunit [Candidatus Omnitrophota bacterium]
MSLPSLSVKRPVATTMFYAAVVLLGIIAFRLLPVEMMPNTSFGDITINIDVRGGIPASEVEKRIAIPIEEAVGSVTHLKNIISISKEGNSTVILEFEPGINMDFAALEVREKFNRIRNKLPAEIEKPVIAKYEYMDVPIMILAATSDVRTPEEIRKIVDEQIKDRIQRIEGVARAEVAGGREGKIIIEIDQPRLQAFAIPINKIVDVINLNNANLLAGEIKTLKNKYLVRTIGEFRSLDDIQNLAIASTKEGSVVRLKDVAKVTDSYLEPVSFARLNAQPVVSIYVQKESNANTIKISSLIEKEVEAIRPTLDKDIKLSLTFNQADAIRQAIKQVESAMTQGAVLASIILFIFLRMIALDFIIASSIPIAILITFFLMYFSKITLNVMSLSGLALGVGMMIDNAIVVSDNIIKKRDEFIKAHRGPAPEPSFLAKAAQDLAITGTDEMLLAIAASTLTTIIVFLPLVYINPEIKMLYSGIAMTITYSLVASLLVALTFAPVLLARIKLKVAPVPEETPPEDKPPDGETPLDKEPSQQLTAELPKMGILESFYKNFISAALSLRYILILFMLVACAYTFKESQKLEKEFIGIAEQNKFTVFIEMPTGTRIEVSDKVVHKVERLISSLPEVRTATAKVEPWSSKIFVELHPLSKRTKSTSEIIDSLRPLTDKLEPAFIYYEEAEEIGTKEIILEFYGYDYEILKNLAIQAAQRLQSVPKFTDTKIRMRAGRPEMQLVIDRRQAAMFGLSPEDISLALHTHMRGLVATRYRGQQGPLLRVKEEPSVSERAAPFTFTPEERELDENLRAMESSIPAFSSQEAKETETIVRLEEKFRRTFEDMRRISLVTPDQKLIYLSQVVQFKFDYGPSEIWRKNKSRMVQVSSNTGGQALGTAAGYVKEVLKDMQMPKDYFWQFGGNYDKMERNQKELRFALGLSLLLIYMLLASLFESLSQPFIILSTVPLAAIGAVWALRYADKAVGIGVLIGSIMLGGIVVNNAIVLVDRINFLREKRFVSNIREAIISSSFDRLRPIMTTSLTTILGLIPMALDKSESANLWSPLAITVMGGMTISTFLTLILIPCIYLIFRDLRLVKK